MAIGAIVDNVLINIDEIHGMCLSVCIPRFIPLFLSLYIPEIAKAKG